MSTYLLPDLRDRLLAGGITTPIHLGRLQDQPDTVIALNDYGAGPSKDPDGRNLPALEVQAVQVIVRAGRADGMEAAHALAKTARRILSGRHLRLGAGGARSYDWIKALQEPHSLGHDENGRPLVLFNLDIQRWGDLSPVPTPPPTPDPEPEP